MHFHTVSKWINKLVSGELWIPMPEFQLMSYSSTSFPVSLIMLMAVWVKKGGRTDRGENRHSSFMGETHGGIKAGAEWSRSSSACSIAISYIKNHIFAAILVCILFSGCFSTCTQDTEKWSTLLLCRHHFWIVVFLKSISEMALLLYFLIPFCIIDT